MKLFNYKNILKYRPNKEVWSFFLLFLIVILFFYKSLLEKDLVGDPTTITLPHYHFIAESLRAGTIPLWFPYSFWGVPEFFRGDASMFNPFIILFIIADIIVNTKDSLTITGNLLELMWVVSLIFGASGMFLLLRKKFNLNRIPSLFASLVFVLGPMILDIGAPATAIGIMVLPWLIYIAINFIESTNFLSFILLVLANYVVFTHGYPYYYLFFFLAQILLVLIYNYKKILLFLFSYTMSLALAAYFLIPNFYVISQSFRNVNHDMTTNFHSSFAVIPTRLVNLLVPRFFNAGISDKDPHWLFSWLAISWGVIPLVFLIMAFCVIKKNSRLHTWVITIFFLSIFYSLGAYLDSVGYLGSVIPVLSKFRSHGQGLIITAFSGSILIGIGVQSAVSGVRVKYIEPVMWGIALVLLTSMILLPSFCWDCVTNNPDTLVSTSRSALLLIASLALLNLVITHKSKFFLILMLFFTLFEYHYYFNIPNGPFADYSYREFYQKNSLIPELPTNDNLFRINFEGDQFAYNTAPLGISNFGGYDTIQSKAWYETKPDGFDKIKNANVKYVVTTEEGWQKDNPNVEYLYMTGPKQHPEETFVSGIPGLSAWMASSTNNHYIYRIKNYLPRFYVPKTIKGCENDACWDKQNPPDLVMVKGSFNEFVNPSANKVNIKVVSYEPNKIKLQVNSPAKTFIVASEAWNKDWRARVNTKSETIYNVSNGIRGIFVPEGESIVEFSYFPRDVIPGTVMSLLGILSLFTIWRLKLINKMIGLNERIMKVLEKLFDR